MVSPPNGPRHELKVYGTAETLPCEMERNPSQWNRWKGAARGPKPLFSGQLRDLRAACHFERRAQGNVGRRELRLRPAHCLLALDPCHAGHAARPAAPGTSPDSSPRGRRPASAAAPALGPRRAAAAAPVAPVPAAGRPTNARRRPGSTSCGRASSGAPPGTLAQNPAAAGRLSRWRDTKCLARLRWPV